MRFLRNAIFISLFLLTAACTSSSNVSSQSTNNNYDREFREQTRSGNTNYSQGQQLEEESEGDPIVSLMLLAMETGDVHPGDDYYVYAVSDLPRERDDIEYIWSIANGDIQQVEESERGRLETIVETEYATASASGQAPAAATDQPDANGAGGGTTAAGGQTSTGGQPANQGSGRPSAGGGGTAAPTWQPGSGSPSGGGGSSPVPGGTTGPPEMTAEEKKQLEESSVEGVTDLNLGGVTDLNLGTSSIKEEKENSEAGGEEQAEPGTEDTKSDASGDGAKTGEPKKDDSSDEKPEKSDPKKEETGKVGYVLEQRVVAGPDDETEVVEGEAETEATASDDSNETTDEEKLALDVHEAAVRVAGLSTQVRPTQTAESNASSETAAFGSVDEPVLGDDGNLLRYEYETWKENGGEKNRRPLAGYGSGSESERVSWDDSCEDCMFVTDDPYILWTPEIPGETSIYVQVRYKHDVLTDPLELQVSIRLKDPAVTLSEDFPDVVREDEAVYLELKAENIPAFDKGLFTIQFDPYKLSYRDAELGEFFDDSPASTIYSAQPDKMLGKVLLAVDTNSNILDISGDGVLAYVKFKAKEDLKEREETGLLLVADTNARYILNESGENVLPLIVQNPPFRTGTAMPPLQPEFERDNTPGTQAPTQSPGANQGVRPGGNTTAPTQTYGSGTAAAPAYTPPQNTGSPAPGVGGAPNPSSGTTIPTPPANTTPNPTPNIPAPSGGGNTPAGGLSRHGLWTPDGPPYSVTAGVGQDSEWLAGKLSGNGSSESEYFFLEEGLAIFTFSLPGTDEASAVLKDGNGASIGRLFAGRSPAGSRAFAIRTAGEYVLVVTGEGDWEISAWQPRVNAASEERSFNGDMTAATVFTTLPSGLNYFEITHSGTENFTVVLLNYEGVRVKSLVNTVGSYNDVVEFDVPQDGMYLFDIIAYDEWTIDIE